MEAPPQKCGQFRADPDPGNHENTIRLRERLASASEKAEAAIVIRHSFRHIEVAIAADDS